MINKPESGLGPYEVYVTSPQLLDEIGVRLIDTGAQVSLVKEDSLKKSIPQRKYREINVRIQGINGKDTHIKKGVLLLGLGLLVKYIFLHILP